MTNKTTAALKLAEAYIAGMKWSEEADEALAAIREALAEQERMSLSGITSIHLGKNAEPVKQESVACDGWSDEVMRQWDYYRSQIANGDKSSEPRDWFESLAPVQPVKQEPVCCETYGCTKPCPKYYTIPVKQEPVTYKPYTVKLPTIMVGRNWHSEEIQRWLDELPPLYVGPVRSEPVKQEPVAWLYRGELYWENPSEWAKDEVTPFYTTPTGAIIKPVALVTAHPEQGLEWLQPPPVWATPLYAAPVDAKANAKERYDNIMAECEEPDPIERLRFFCSLAMTGKNWIDVEEFFDDLIAERKAIRANERYFCQRCGKRIGDHNGVWEGIHTCTPPDDCRVMK